MVELTRRLIANQMDAALQMLGFCIEQCPESAWDAPVANLAFCQAVFHTLFYADCYLGADTPSLREQPFHRAHPEFFRTYEELEDKSQELLYDRPAIRLYLRHCRTKAAEVIAAETADSLAAACGFPWLKFSRAELYVYNIRHVQHHAAQLSLRLRLDGGDGVRWAKSADPHDPIARWVTPG